MTDARGVATFRALPRVTTTYRVEFAGNEQWLPASAEVNVPVRPQISVSAPFRVYRGARLRLGVRVRPAHPGAEVTVELRKDGVWAEWRTLKLDDDSRTRRGLRVDQTGTRTLRVVMAGDEGHASGVSRVRRVAVVKRNPYGVPLSAKRLVVVDKSQYRLYFFSYGRKVKSFPCVLGRPGLPTPTGRFRIYAKGMWPGGPFGARIMSYHSPYAIHGTNEPHLLRRFPRNYSHGCTRLAQRQRHLALRSRPGRHAGVERAVRVSRGSGARRRRRRASRGPLRGGCRPWISGRSRPALWSAGAAHPWISCGRHLTQTHLLSPW